MVLRRSWIIKSVKMKDRPITGEELVKRGFSYIKDEDKYVLIFSLHDFDYDQIGPYRVELAKLNEKTWSVNLVGMDKQQMTIQSLQDLNKVFYQFRGYFKINKHITDDFLKGLGFEKCNTHRYCVNGEFGFSLTMIESGEDLFVINLVDIGKDISKFVHSVEELKWFLEDNNVLDLVKWKQ